MMAVCRLFPRVFFVLLAGHIQLNALKTLQLLAADESNDALTAPTAATQIKPCTLSRQSVVLNC